METNKIFIKNITEYEEWDDGEFFIQGLNKIITDNFSDCKIEMREGYVSLRQKEPYEDSKKK